MTLLTDASIVNGTNTYLYDANGSLTNKASAGGVITGYTYDLANKLNGVFDGSGSQKGVGS
jgi:YD repeat-containing protein